MRTMTDSEIERLLCGTMEAEVIKQLLSGNDTQCFNTKQYADARDAWIAKLTGSTRESLGIAGDLYWHLEYARRQLAAFPTVVQVSTDVWTLKTLHREQIAVKPYGGGPPVDPPGKDRYRNVIA